MITIRSDKAAKPAVTFQHRRIRIGSDSRNDLVIDDFSVEKFHAQIVQGGDGIKILSPCGAKVEVDGQAVIAGFLNLPCEVVVGKVRLELSQESGNPATSAVDVAEPASEVTPLPPALPSSGGASPENAAVKPPVQQQTSTASGTATKQSSGGKKFLVGLVVILVILAGVISIRNKDNAVEPRNTDKDSIDGEQMAEHEKVFMRYSKKQESTSEYVEPDTKGHEDDNNNTSGKAPVREHQTTATARKLLLMSVEPEKEVVNSSATLATPRPSNGGKIDTTKPQIMREIPELFRGGWHPDPRDRTWGQISDQEGDGLKGIKLEANSISVYEGGLGFPKVELLEQGKAIRVGGRWFFEGTAGDYEELFFRISPDGKVLKNQDGTSYYRTAKVERRLKDQLHTKKSNKPSRVYFGKYGRDNAFCSIQWMGDDTLRGGVFLHESGRLLSFYATNYIQGKLNGELWEAGKLLGNVVVRKDPASGRVAWRGFNPDSGMEFNFGRNSNRRASKEFHSSYVGRVGNSNVDIGLQWKGDGTLSGSYYSRATGRRYRLEGDNTVDGFLYLDEFTDDNLSARILLNKKRLSNGSIAWEGTMFNTDGRNKNMSFVKRQ